MPAALMGRALVRGAPQQPRRGVAQGGLHAAQGQARLHDSLHRHGKRKEVLVLFKVFDLHRCSLVA